MQLSKQTKLLDEQVSSLRHFIQTYGSSFQDTMIFLRFFCLLGVLCGFMIMGCSHAPKPLLSPQSNIPPNSQESVGHTWVIAPPLKGDELGDWYFLRARTHSHNIAFYQLCLRDRRTAEEGWAFYEKAIDDKNQTYPTVVQNRKIYQNAVMKELVGVMLTREDLLLAEKDGLALHIQGQFDTMDVWLQPAYVKGFLLLVEEFMNAGAT